MDIRYLTHHEQDHDNDPMPRRPRLVTVKAAANYLGVTERTIRRMIADGRLTGYRVEGSRFIRVDLGEIKDKLRPV